MLADRAIEKLGFEPGHRVCLVDAPPEIAAALAVAAKEVQFTDYLGLRGFDHILWWPADLTGLDVQLGRLAYCIRPSGSVWLVIPKHQYAAQRGIRFSWAEMQAIALLTDLVDSKTVSLSGTDYATRFVIRTKHRARYE